MSHATHFLDRLQRLPTRHLDFALGLYRNAPLVRYVLGQERLPAGAERVALAIENRPNGPHIIVARDGGFVTCLGEGMSIGDHPVVSRSRLDVLRRRHDQLNEALALIDDRSEITRLFETLTECGASLSREDFQALSVVVPLVELTFADCIYDLSMSATKYQKRYRRARYRRLHKDKALQKELRKYWLNWWTMGHLVALCGTRGHKLGESDGLCTSRKDPAIGYLLSVSAMLSAIPPIMLRGAWTAARAGRKAIAHCKSHLQTARSCLGVLSSGLPLLLIALRHRSARAEVQKLLARTARQVPKTMAGNPEAELVEHLLSYWGTLFEPGALTEAHAVHAEMGAGLVYRWGQEHLPAGHPTRFESEAEVPEELASVLLVNLYYELFGHNGSLLMLSSVVPWLAEANAEELYVPERWMDIFAEPWDPQVALRHLDTCAMSYIPPTVINEQVRPGRNQPCPCGSGVKYKRCCL